MNYSFKKPHIRLLSLVLTVLLTVGLFSGCKKADDTPTIPSTEDNLPPGLVEVKPTETETTPPETTEPIDENAAVINKNQTAVRQTPSSDADPIGHLDKDTKVTIIREVSIGGVGWTLIREGWVPTDNLDKSYVPDTTEPQGGETTDPSKPDDNKDNKDDKDKDKDTDKGNTTSTNTNTGNGTKGVVTASELNIREEANQSAKRLDAYHHGDRITILETKNGWGRTNKGWVSLEYVYQDGTKGSNGCNGVTTASTLNVRSGPGTNYDRVESLNYGSRVNVLERITIAGTTWGCVKGGWISMDHVYVDGTEGPGAGEGTCTGDNVNIRSGPGTAYNPVGSANKNDAIKIYAQIQIGEMTWGYVSKGNIKGWMSMQYANMG